jgi:hypothetical protein
MPSLFFTKLDLAIASLVLTYAIHQVFKGDFLCIRSLNIQQYSISGNVVDNILSKGKLAVVFTFQKTYYSAGIRALKGKRTIS